MANILAARDQENLTHAHHTAAAAKPLNQTTRTAHPKTTGNLKTPFRASKNDENLPLGFTARKAFDKERSSKPDSSAFVTLPNRNRAPLGAKTTNAKGFQTPAPLTARPGRTTQKPLTSSRRSNKSKIHIATSEHVDDDVLSKPVIEEPDFGYAPPRPIELPDPPIEFEEDPRLTEALLRSDGMVYPYDSPKDESGMSIRLKKEEDEWKKYDEGRMRQVPETLDRPVFPSLAELNQQVDDMIASGPKKTRAPLSRVDSTEARSAVAALSDSQSRLPSAVTRPTQTSEQKKRTIAPALSAHPKTARSNHAALSKNTIGFPKAKKAASIIPRAKAIPTPKPAKVDQTSIHPRDFRDLYGSPPEESDMWFRLKRYELLEEDLARDNNKDEGELFDSDFFPFDNAKLDDEDFQLPVPE